MASAADGAGIVDVQVAINESYSVVLGHHARDIATDRRRRLSTGDGQRIGLQ